MDGESALERLVEGNARFVEGRLENPNSDQARRSAVSDGQSPFAVVVGCSDSRVPPEVLFDAGLGDLFVIRTAGHVVDDVALGSIEYAVAHLDTPLIVVLGHTKCGAVTACVEGGDAPGSMDSLMEALAPAVDACQGDEGDHVRNAVIWNVRLTMSIIHEASAIIDEATGTGATIIVGAVYDLDTGVVEIIE